MHENVPAPFPRARRAPVGDNLDLDERTGGIDMLGRRSKVVGSVRVARDFRRMGANENEVPSRFSMDVRRAVVDSSMEEIDVSQKL